MSWPKFLLVCLLIFAAACAAAQHETVRTKTVEVDTIDAATIQKLLPLATGLWENFEKDPVEKWMFIGDAKAADVGHQRALVTNGFAFGVWQTQQLTNFTVRFRYRHALGFGDIVLRGTPTDPPEHLYHIILANDRIAIVREQHQKQLELKAAAYTLTPGQWYDFGIRIDGGRIELAIDGKTVMTGEDANPLPAGLLALGSLIGNGFAFDDISLTPAGQTAKMADDTDRFSPDKLTTPDSGKLVDPAIAIEKPRGVRLKVARYNGAQGHYTIDPGSIPPNFVHTWALDIKDIDGFKLGITKHDQVRLDWGSGDQLIIVNSENKVLAAYKTIQEVEQNPVECQTSKFDKGPYKRISTVPQWCAD